MHQHGIKTKNQINTARLFYLQQTKIKERRNKILENIRIQIRFIFKIFTKNNKRI